jgi:hypothetical protein
MTITLSPASRRFGTRLSTLALADDVDFASVQSVLRFSSIAKQVLFPLEPCIFFENRAEEWIGPLTTDSAYLHCLIFTAQYFFDAKCSGRRGNEVPVNNRTMSHFIKGLAMLRQRMLDDNSSNELRFTNSTAAAVMGLSSHALVTGDLDFAKNHLDGLARIVVMRGGFSTFYNGSEKLLVEILRYVSCLTSRSNVCSHIRAEVTWDFHSLVEVHLSSWMQCSMIRSSSSLT